LNELTTHNDYSVDGDERETPIFISTNSHRFVCHVVVLAILATFTAASYAAGNLASSSAPADVQDAQASTPAPPPTVAPAPASPAAQPPAPLPTFVLTGPLQWLPPVILDAGALGKLSINGILTGFYSSRTILCRETPLPRPL